MNLVRTIGVEPDPAKRLRKRWGTEMRYTREQLLHWTLDELAARMVAAGYQITAQAISSWERGDTSPKWSNQIGWCKVVGRTHHEVFVMDDAA